jgi:hypothetical protein
VDDSLAVGVLERLHQRQQGRDDLSRFATSKLGKISAFHILHGDEDGSWVDMKIEDPDDVRMGQPPGVAALLPQEGDLVRGGTRGHNLGNDLGSQILVSGQPTVPHPTSSEAADEGESRG